MPDPAEVAEAVARNARRLRTAQGWSLDALAKRAGVSKGMLVQIEAARTNPSIGTLCKVAEALHVSLAGLIEVDEPQRVRIVAPGEAATFWTGAEGGTADLLVGADEPGHLELWEWRMAPGEVHEADAHADGTLELLHVHSGTLTLDVEGEAHELRPGAAAGYLADRPHAYRNAHRRPVRFTMVVLQTEADLVAWTAAQDQAGA